MRIALVTSTKLPEEHWHDSDTALVADELRRSGAQADVVAWDSPSPITWASFDAIVLQSPWSMWQRRAEFRQWLDARADEDVCVLNPPDVVRRGSDKRYLLELARAGVRTVPTTIIESGSDHADLRSRLRAAYPHLRAARRTIVVKPVASGGALDTGEFSLDRLDDAAAHAQALIESGRAAVVQPYIEAIDTHRELAVVTLMGSLSHAITKAPILRPDSDQHAFHPDPQPYALSAHQASVAQEAYRAFLALRPVDSPPPLSVRLDFVIDPDSDPGLLLLEVEAVAPVRFFPMHRDRVAPFARAILTLAVAAAHSTPG